MSDIRKLIEAVEGGGCPWIPSAFGNSWFAPDTMKRVKYAYNGDLNAAKALHEALLPGWGSCRMMSSHGSGFCAEVFPGELPQVGRSDSSSTASEARAWLIAILKAYEAKQ